MQIPENLNSKLSQEEIYRIVADFTFDWEELHSLDGTLLYVSPSCERITGYQPEEFYTNPNLLSQIVHPDDCERVMAHLAQVCQHPDRGDELEFRLIHRDGEVRWIGHNCQPVFSPDGSLLAYRSSNQDITLRKQAEMQAAENHHTILAVLDNPVAIALILNLDGTIQIANQTFASRFGKSKEELVGMVSWDLLPEPIRGIRKASVLQVVQTGKAVRYQDQGVHAIYDNIIYPIFDEQGQLFRVGVQARDITEILRGKTALQESEATIRSLINTPSTIMLLLDRHGKIINTNTAFAEMLRAARPETPDAKALEGQILWDILPLEAADLRKEGLEKVLLTRQPLHVEEPSPTGLWYDTWVYPILDQQGEVSRVVVMGHDITDRIRAEEVIRQNEATIRALLNAPSVLIILLDQHGNILLANETIASMMEFKPEEMVGKCLWEFFPPERSRFRRSIFEEVWRTGQPQRVDDHSSTGELFDSLVFPILDSTGQVTQVAILSRDVTQIKKTQDALWESEVAIRALINGPMDVTGIFDPSGRILLMNDTYAQMLGKTPQEVQGALLWDFNTPEETERGQAILDQVVTSGQPLHYEEIDQATQSYYDVIAYPLYDIEGKINRIAALGRDITQSKLAEEALRNSEQQLRTMINNLPGILFVITSEGVLKLVEGVWLKELGISTDQLIGRKPADFLSPIYNTPSWLKRLFSGEINQEQISFQGHIFDVHYSQVKDEHGAIAEVIGVAIDITEAQKAKDQLNRTKNQLQAILDGAAFSITALYPDGGVALANQIAAQRAGYPSVEEYMAAPASQIVDHFDIWDETGQLLTASQLPGMRSFLGQHGPPIMIRYRDRQSGREGWAQLGDTPIFNENGQVEMVVVVWHNMTEIKQAQEILQRDQLQLEQLVAERTAELEKANQQLLLEEERIRRSAAHFETMANIVSQINAQVDLQPTLQVICDETVKSLGFAVCGIMLVDSQSDHLRMAAINQTPYQGKIAAQLPPLPRPIYEALLDTPDRSILIPDLAARPDLPFIEVSQQIATRTVISLPLSQKSGATGEEELIGALHVASLGETHIPTEEELVLLSALAEQASVAIIKAQLYRQAQEGQENLKTLSRQLVSAQESERRKLAQELHDEVGQTITFLNILLNMSAQQATVNGVLPEPMAEKIQSARQLTAQLLQHVRDLSIELRPPLLDDLGLLPALINFIERYSEQTGIQVEFHHSLAEHRFASEIENTAFRVVQQALINIVRHAQTDYAQVRLWSFGDTLGVQVEDHGVGFDSQAVLASKTFGGLPSLREQVALVGGKLEIESAPQYGACLTAEFPLQIHNGSMKEQVEQEQ
jgi:PAS domain S-box-containing protein